VSKSFSNLRTRYIFLDFILVTIALSIVCTIFILANGLKVEVLSKNKILEFAFNLLCITGLSLCIAKRLKTSGVQSQYLIGNIPLQKLPWMMIAIVFYGIETLQRGLMQLTLFLVNLAAPTIAQSEIIRNRAGFIYETDSLSLKILFYVFIFISAVVIAPLAEEFLFRGIFLHRFSAKWGVGAGIIISSALFGICHGNIASISLGISFSFMALLYIKIPSLLVPISCHAMHNIIWFISKTVTEISGVPDSSDITIKSLWFGLMNIAFALPILFYFLKWPTDRAALPYNVNSQASEHP
jgi:uncharacterized protein